MTEIRLPFTSIVEALPANTPFVGPEALERQRGTPFRLRIGANESNFGISPQAAEAMRAAISQVSWYGDPENYDLRAVLAEQHGVGMDEICVAGGIDELLGLMVRLVAEPGTPIVTSLGAYPTFNYHVAGFGCELHTVPYRDDHEDPDGLSDAAIRLQAPLVYFANPDNPMGTWHNADTINSFIRQLPQTSLLILDEAYIDFAPQEAVCPIDTSIPHLVRMRTFSKAHGMAGARIGYAIAERGIITGLNKIRNQFAVNRIAQAGALASLQDREFVAGVIAAVDAGRQDYYRLAAELGVKTLPSATNFVAFDIGADGERARRLLQRLHEQGVFVRMPGVAPLDRCIRVSVGRPDERRLFAQILRDTLPQLT
jgi:histidinol-phosphate aminotransferase